ncbi:MAG: hypothetical protein HYZ68_04020 [Chloroflexi bacterium]|nr:hypothetical protein [Chloroflexota bacterium]
MERPLAAKKMESVINQIQGVVASRVVPDEREGLSEIHVMTSTARAAKQIVRDIESLLFVRFGIKIDYRKISLVQLSDEQLAPLGFARLRLASARCAEGPGGWQAEVAIEGPEGAHLGRAEGSEPPARLVVRAMLQALQDALGQGIQLNLREVREFDWGERRIVVVEVSHLFPAGEESLLGVSFSAGEGEVAAPARAALDAINRRLPMMGS